MVRFARTGIDAGNERLDLASPGLPWPPLASLGLPWPPLASIDLPWPPLASLGLPLPPFAFPSLASLGLLSKKAQLREKRNRRTKWDLSI